MLEIYKKVKVSKIGFKNDDDDDDDDYQNDHDDDFFSISYLFLAPLLYVLIYRFSHLCQNFHFSSTHKTLSILEHISPSSDVPPNLNPLYTIINPHWITVYQ